jgi:small nuclear ribonucleoprotein (snRNP)-like protein
MKTSIVIVITFGFLAAGCSSTLNVKETNEEQIEEKLIKFQKEEAIGSEVTLSLKFGEEISGELLSVRDSTITVCTEYSATEKELASLKYPINIVRNEEIKELTIKGSNYVWIGLAIGAATFTGIGIWIGHEIEKGLDTEGGKEGVGIIGFLVGAIVGGIVGYLLSTDDVILQEIPAANDLYILKPLARYSDQESEYLKAIK